MYLNIQIRMYGGSDQYLSRQGSTREGPLWCAGHPLLDHRALVHNTRAHTNDQQRGLNELAEPTYGAPGAWGGRVHIAPAWRPGRGSCTGRVRPRRACPRTAPVPPGRRRARAAGRRPSRRAGAPRAATATVSRRVKYSGWNTLGGLEPKVGKTKEIA